MVKVGPGTPVRAPIDGGLRQIFKAKLAVDAQWTTIETGAVALGVPDSEFCFAGGAQGWVEFKATNHWRPKIREMQVQWIDKRARLGGNVWIAVRRMGSELWLVPGSMVVELSDGGLEAVFGRCLVWYGGPVSWPWKAIRGHLGA